MGSDPLQQVPQSTTAWHLTTDAWDCDTQWADLDGLDAFKQSNIDSMQDQSMSRRFQVNTPVSEAEPSDGGVLSLLAECVGASNHPEKICSYLDDITIEMHDGQFEENILRLKGSSRLESVFQLVRYSMYLSSNSLLSATETRKILSWLVETKSQWVLDPLLNMKNPTTEVSGRICS